MAWFGEVGRRLLALVRWRTLQRDLDEEMQLHIELRAEEERERGLSPEAARRAAQRRFGNTRLLRESGGDVWGWSWLLALAYDTRYAMRTMLRSPGFAAVAVLALALGVGANTAVFSVVDAVLLRSLPYADEEELVVVLHGGSRPVSARNLRDWREQSRSFTGMGAAEYWTANLMGHGSSEEIVALRVTADLFPLLGVRPLLGRLFAPEEEQPGRDRAVILGHGLWQRRFAGDAAVIGRTLNLGGEDFTVVGVMPADFRFAPFWVTRAEMWVPLSVPPEARDNRSHNSLRAFARLKPGVSLESARAEVNAIAGRLEREFPGTNRDVQVVPLRERVVGPIQIQLVVVFCAAAFVLLIACANLAHLLLARGAARQREIAVRAALGAGRSRLIRQLLTESMLLVLLGGGAGVLVAVWGVNALVALSPDIIPRIETVGVDGRALLFTAVLSLATGLAVGVVPALQSSRVDLDAALRDGARGATGGVHKARLRALLVVSQVAMTLVLLVGAGLMIRTSAALQAIDPGFEPDQVVSMKMSLDGAPAGESGQRAVFYQGILRRVESLPGVVSAGAINHLPLAGDVWGHSYEVEGRPPPGPGDQPNAIYRVVMPGYFRTMKIPIVRGRDVTAADSRAAAGVVVINQQLARDEWPGEDPIGKRITLGGPQPLTVVGVVKDSRQGSWSEAPGAEMYIPYLQSDDYLRGLSSVRAYMTLVVRASVDPAALVPAIAREIRAQDSLVTLAEIQTMDRVVGEANARPRLYLVLMGGFAALALILAIIGIYGVMSYSVSQRIHEIGVRMALGARRRDVLRLVLGQALVMTMVGIAIGLGLAIAVGRLMKSFLYGVSPTDPLTLTAVPMLLALVALAATYVPARRAVRVDPMSSLRAE
jgi:predicted permease